MRKLAWAALSFSMAIFISHYMIPRDYLLFSAAALALIGACGIVCKGKLRTGILLVCMFAALGMLRYDLYAQDKLDTADDVSGRVCRITAVVTEYPTAYDDYVRVVVRLERESLPPFETVMYDYSFDCADLIPGDVIYARARLSSAAISAGEESDTYISKGIFLRAYLDGRVVTRWQEKDMRYAPQFLAQWIRDTLDTHTPHRAAVFLKALLTGDKTALYDEPLLYNALSKAGVSHIVAVSGMHVSFLVGLVVMLAGSRRGWILSVLSLILFSLMTGMSPSVLRAAFMQTLFLLAPVLRREADGITSISFALMILLLVNPFSAASISLQLSFGAMAGIILFTGRVMDFMLAKGEKLHGFFGTAYHFVCASVSTSIGATIFTTPLCAYYFGYISLLAPLTNLLILWIVPYCFGGGFLVCLLSVISDNLAALTGTAVSWAVEFIYTVTGWIAESPFAVAYLPGKHLAFWFIITYGMFVLAYVLKGKSIYRPLIPICISVSVLFTMMTDIIRQYENGTTVAALDVGQGQSIVMLDDDVTLMMDCGGAYDSGDRAVHWLYTHGRHRVDMLILTHYDGDHVNGVVDLLYNIPVTQILCLSGDLHEDERKILTDIQTHAAILGTEVTTIAESKTFQMGEVSITAFVLNKKSSNDGIIVLAQRGEYDMLVLGDADFDYEMQLVQAYDLPDGECLVAGHHGAKSSTGLPVIQTFSPEYALISSGYNHYGHPRQEVLDRLSKENVVIYRTDELGSIELKVR